MNPWLRTLFALLFLLPALALRAQIITTIAGTPTVSGFIGAGGPATAAKLGDLYAVAVDKGGNIYTSDDFNHVIWKISTAGIISLYAGTGVQGYTGDGAPATAAKLYDPLSLSVDNLGNLYVLDQDGACVRKIDPSGIITTIARNTATGAPPTGDGGPLSAATFTNISGFVPDNAGNFYISDWLGNTIRKVNSAGIISTIAGTGAYGFGGDGGPATAAQFSAPQQVAFDNAGNIYIPDENNGRIRKIDAAGIITTVAGNGGAGFSGDGGPATNATFFGLWQVAFDACNNMYIADAANRCIRKVDNAGIISTYAGIGGVYGYSGDGGPANQAKITGARGIAFDNSGNMFISDEENFIVRKVTPLPAAQFTQQPVDNAICAGGNTSFSVTATGPTTFQWQTNSPSGWTDLADGGVYSGTTTNILTVTAAVAGMNATQYRCSILGACGPVASTAALLTVKSSPSPEVSITPSEDVICTGTKVTFTANAINGGNQPMYQWQLDGQNVGTNSATYTNANLKDQDLVTCVLTSSLTCTSPVNSQNQITMTVNAAPTVITIPDTLIGLGQSVVLQTTVSAPVISYQWTPAAGLDNPYSAAPTAAPENTTTYKVVVTTDAGCTASGEVTLGVAKTLKMPDAFTPNGDGNNDFFRIPRSSPVKLMNFAVYDRWGARVFYTSNSATGWNGTFGGLQEPPGTYVWVIDYVDAITGKPVEAKGTVILIR